MIKIKHKLWQLMISFMMVFTVSVGAQADSPFIVESSSSTMLAEFIEPDMASAIEALDEDEMASIRGELWPLIGAIGAVVSVDIAIQAYFFGVYVPAMSTTTHYTATTPIFR